MATVDVSNGLGGGFGSTFVSGAPGVAALDTPQLVQTKAEIRTLVAEIAELSAADIDSDEFMRGMLSRVCMAMGASAALVWKVAADQSVELTASHNLPEALDESNADAAAAHRRVLTCVAVEGQPILVPPGSIRIEAERPANPIDEALLIVPIRTHSRVDALLEVIQPGGGGPAAQRGYLRFVAQMADLLADHLRRHRLHELANQAEYGQRLQQHLLAICTARLPSERWQATATAISSLLDVDLALLLSKARRRWQVRAISGLDAFDPRSETVATAQRCLSSLECKDTLAQGELQLLAETPTADGARVQADTLQGDRPTARPAEAMRELLACDQLFRLALTSDGRYQVLLASDRSIDGLVLAARARELSPALDSLLAAGRHADGWSTWLPGLGQPQTSHARRTWRARAEQWIVRASTVGLVIAVAVFPTPDQVATVAVLEAQDKQLYYAPATATIERVLVDSGQSVKAGDVLLVLSDKQLEAELNEVTGQRLTADTQLTQDTATLKRGQQSPQQLDELESRIVQSRITRAALDERLSILRAQAERLKISAREDAIVTTWDARNRLEGRPVMAGQLLLATCAHEANWRLQLTIDQHKAGMVQNALAATEQGLPVHFSLSSHPADVRTGRLVNLSQQLVNGEDGTAKVLGTVLVDAQSLPAKTDGAVARAAIDCGRVTAIWFVIRDAYREASAWVRMMW